MTRVAPLSLEGAERADAPPGGPVPVRPVGGPLPLEYAGRRTPRRPLLRRIWAGLYDLGPVLPKPSLLTLALLIACLPATYWIAHRPQAWRVVRSVGVGVSNGPFPNVHYLPHADAAVSANAAGGLRVWRPWTDELLLNTQAAPNALPPNPPRGALAWWVTASADGSKLLGKSDRGAYLWDGRTGRLLADLSTDLGPEGAKRHLFSLGALSPDAAFLCVVNDRDELLLYDVAGPAARLLARRPLTRPPNVTNFTTPDPRYHIEFSPDGRNILVTCDTLLWLGDASNLGTCLSWKVPYATRGDAVFLRGGRRLLTLIHGWGGAQEVRLYDLDTRGVLRHWPVPDDPYELAVSPDERRAVVGVTGQAAMVLELDENGGGDFARRVPQSQWMFWRASFFPDNRRAVVGGLWQHDPGIADLSTGRHVANLEVPPDPGARHATILPGGKRLFVVTGTRLHVFEHAGRESALGVFATVPFWALALCVALLVVSFGRDALRSRRRRGRGAVPVARAGLAAALAVAGGAALTCPFVWLALGPAVYGNPYTWWEDDGWLVWVFVFHLLGALGVLAGSRLWTVLVALSLAAGVKLGLWLASTAGGFAEHPERVFDRMWMLPPAGMAGVQVAWAALALAGLAMLLARPRARQATGTEPRGLARGGGGEAPAAASSRDRGGHHRVAAPASRPLPRAEAAGEE